MEHRKFWNVLIVDDEPDIHEVTRLSLRRESVFGAKLKLYHANSAQEARDFFDFNDAARSLSVAFIDVVMETDSAGLDLCKWIREEKNEHVTQLILRTGQPGKAPPRQIVDECNISGYLTKTEATGDRLYMALKTAIQQYYNLQYLFWHAELCDMARNHSASPSSLFAQLQAMMTTPPPEELGFEFHRAMDFWGQHYIGQGCLRDRGEYEKIIKDLLLRGGEDLARTGVASVDDYVVVKTRVLGSDHVAHMVVKDANYPHQLTQLYGSVWRQNLSYWSEVFFRIPK